MGLSNIEWTDYTFNSWRGCTKVNDGCTNCYAEVDYSVRMHGVKWGPSGNRMKTSASYWKQPLKWNREAEDPVKGGMVPGDIDGANPGQHYLRPGDDRTFVCMASHAERGVWLTCGEKDEDEWYCKTPEEFAEAGWLPQRHRPRVFCASLADVFEDWDKPVIDHKGNLLWRESGPGLKLDDLRRDLFNLIDATPNLDWLLLTKRPENVRQMWPTSLYEQEAMSIDAGTGGSPMRENVWLGTSMSDQATADKAIPELLKCRDLSPVLFASYEPALGPVDWENINFGSRVHCDWHNVLWPQNGLRYPGDGSPLPELPSGSLDWIIVGGESGPHARPCNIEWIESTIDQCREAGVPCFVKQLGAKPTSEIECLLSEVTDKKGGDPAEWPEHLRVREFPNATAPI